MMGRILFQIMSRLVSRILLSMFMFPLAALLYVISMVVCEENMRGNSFSDYQSREMEMFLISGILTWLFVAGYWCLLWKSSVRWTMQRRITTWSAAGASALAAFAVAFL